MTLFSDYRILPTITTHDKQELKSAALQINTKTIPLTKLIISENSEKQNSLTKFTQTIRV